MRIAEPVAITDSVTELTEIKEDHAGIGEWVRNGKEKTVNETQNMSRAMEEATDLETITNWKSWMPHLTPIRCMYKNGEPRRYYKHKHSDRIFFRRVSECEMYKNV